MIFLIKVTDVMTQKRALKVTDVLTHPGNRCPDICHISPKTVSRGGAENTGETKTKGLKYFGVKPEIICLNLFSFDSLRVLCVSA